MKICPTCQGTYPDNISFCSRDGAALAVMEAWSEGTVVRNRYRILNKVGEGGMGTVYKALHTGFDEVRALKVISPELVSDELFVKRFKQEAFITRKLQHPNAVRVDDVDEAEDGRPFIVMEYIDGRSLKKLIQEEGPLPAPRVCSIVKQVAGALDAAHRLGIVHRDIKPENIVLVKTPEGEQGKVLDFGIAKVKEARAGREATGLTLTGVGMVVGTPQYMSPEQAKGMRGDELDGRSDIYSLGVVMYQMLSGDLPFKADTTMDMLLAHMQKPPRPILLIRPDVYIPEALATLVMRTLQKKPESRPPSAAALIEEILRAEKGMPGSVPRLAEPPGGQAREAQVPSALGRAAETPAGPVLPQGATAQQRPAPSRRPAAQPALGRPGDYGAPAPAAELRGRSSQFPRGMVFWVAVLVAGLGSGGWYFATHRPAAQVEQHRAEGERLESQKLYAQAEQEYRAAILLDAQNAGFRAHLGSVLIQQKKWDEGIASYREALRLKPDDAEAHNNLGVSLQAEGNLFDAITEYREALRLKPDYVDAHNNLGDALQKQNDLDGSIAEYHEVLRLKPDDAEAHYHLGIAFYKKGSADQALAEYREAVRLRPGFALAHFGLGGVLYNQGDRDAGLAELRTAYMLAPDDPEIRVAYQKLLEK